MSRIRILIVDSFLSPGGGQEKVVLQLLNLLDRNLFEVFFATGTNSIIPVDIPEDVKVFRVGFKSKFDLTTCLETRKIIRRERIQIVNIHGLRASLLVRLAYLLSRRVKIIYTSHVNYDQLKQYSKSKLNRFSTVIGNFLDYAATDLLVFVSQKNLSNRLNDSPKIDDKKCKLIYNGINPENLLVSAPAKKNSVKTIVTLSALVHRKGIHILVEAAKILIDRGVREFEIKIGGDGEEKQNIQTLINNYGLEKKVFLVGFVNKTSLLSSADIFVLPTYSEGLPLSIVEAGFYELPVVATAVDGIPEVIYHNKTGLLVNAGEPIELADSIHKVLSDDFLAKKLGRELKNVVETKFSECKMIEGYNNLFSEEVNLVRSKHSENAK